MTPRHEWGTRTTSKAGATARATTNAGVLRFAQNDKRKDKGHGNGKEQKQKQEQRP
jgi:hypothetical protein